MLSLFSRIGAVSASPLSSLSHPLRTFIARTHIPTVYEGLPKRRNGENALEFLQKELLNKYDRIGKRRALVDSKTGLRAGDVIKVTYGDRTSVVGQVIAIKRGHNNVGTNILVRNKYQKIGVEVRVPLYNPNVKNIEVVHKPAKYMPRNKQYYIRNTKVDVGDVEQLVKQEYKKTHDY